MIKILKENTIQQRMKALYFLDKKSFQNRKERLSQE